jgi:hypothetical protein
MIFRIVYGQRIRIIDVDPDIELIKAKTKEEALDTFHERFPKPWFDYKIFKIDELEEEAKIFKIYYESTAGFPIIENIISETEENAISQWRSIHPSTSKITKVEEVILVELV